MSLPTDVDVAEAQALSTLRRARKLWPGRVVTYTPPTPATIATAAIELGFVAGTPTGQSGKPLILPSCPVLWPRFAGVGMFGRLDPGDEVLVAVADRSLDAWLVAGGPVPLDSDRMHSFTDAVVLLGLSSNARPQPVSSAVNMVIGREDGSGTVTINLDGPATVTVEGVGIRLGATATMHPVLGELLHAYLLAWITAAATAPLDGAATFKAALIAYLGTNPLTQYTTTKVTAE